MPLWTKQDLMSACNASDPTSNFLKCCESVNGISIDDRTIKKGELFIALVGNNCDGHNYIESAVSKGACGVIVSSMKLAKKYNGLFVKNTQKALIEIGRFARNRFSGITIGITGSSGKTSTKYLLSNALIKFGKTHRTFGNYNNLIGLALITNVSSSHIQNFKNEEEIAKAKSEIFFGLENDGVAIINADNTWAKLLISEAKKINAKIHLYGRSKNSDTKIIKIIDDKEGSTIFYDKIKNWHLKYLNITQGENAIAAISVIKELKLEPDKAANIISYLKPLSGRGEKLTINFSKNKKSFIIDDSYNANPDSMKAALYNFNKLKLKLHHFEAVVIIGDMLELGESSGKMHLELVPILQEIKPDLLFTLGNKSRKIYKKLKLTLKCYSYSKIDDLIKDIKQFIKPNQIILLKGSNGTGLWKLVPEFKNIIQENGNAA